MGGGWRFRMQQVLQRGANSAAARPVTTRSADTARRRCELQGSTALPLPSPPPSARCFKSNSHPANFERTTGQTTHSTVTSNEALAPQQHHNFTNTAWMTKRGEDEDHHHHHTATPNFTTSTVAVVAPACGSRRPGPCCRCH